jgi:maltooligosyltrehalose trehalohydrolase
VEVAVVAPEPARIPLGRTADGYHVGEGEGAPGARYFFLLDGQRRRPDPWARALPVGVHGPAEIVDLDAFVWTDHGWRGRPLHDLVLYELHVGTFTPDGTFDAIIPRLDRLAELGVTALELMPVASFPGIRNWGYDGVGLFAPQQSYGGPAGLQRLVDACHARGLAVFLDVVYNHLGPEGNYLAEFGPFFTDRYRTPWGAAMNFDGEGSRGVRDFVVANALSWIRDYHIDGLRLDAVHGIFDASPIHILREVNDAVQALAAGLGRHVPVVAESDQNDRRVLDPTAGGGLGLAGVWNDDFHHSLHALLTGERSGYYADFGAPEQLAKAIAHGFVYDGLHSVARGRPHGTATTDIPGERFVVFAQNHDQVGNRAWGERLGSLTDLEGLKLAATALLLSPSVPLLFMGEEYGDPAPFLFFTDFEEPALREAVSRGRQEEFTAFRWGEATPDPQDPVAFSRSRLTWPLQERPPHDWLRAYYQGLLAIRKSLPSLAAGGKERTTVEVLEARTLALLRRGADGRDAVVLLRFAPEPGAAWPWMPAGIWRRLLDSAEPRFGGLGADSPPVVPMPDAGRVRIGLGGHGAAVYRRDPPGSAICEEGFPAGGTD